MIKKSIFLRTKIKVKKKQAYSLNATKTQQLKKNYGIRTINVKKRKTPVWRLLRSKSLSLTVKVNRQIIYNNTKIKGAASHIKFLKKISCLRGFRHRSFLPTRGQKTKANGKTRKKARKGAKNYPLIKSKAKKNAKKKKQKKR